jgi:hypothetical protein
MKNTIQFPEDFRVSENPFLMFAVNYIYVRENGSIISVLKSDKGDLEVWDERYMEDIEIMSFQEFFEYLKKEPLRKMYSEINWN